MANMRQASMWLLVAVVGCASPLSAMAATDTMTPASPASTHGSVVMIICNASPETSATPRTRSLLCKDDGTLSEVGEVYRDHCTRYPEDCRAIQRFRSYQPNYFIYQTTEKDERSLEVHYSLRYILSDLDCLSRHEESTAAVAKKVQRCLKYWGNRPEIYVTYTGEFDFYVDMLGQGRTSSPVVNRVSNPALHLRIYRRPLSTPGEHPRTRKLQWVNFSFEHRSDGQVGDADELLDAGTSSERFRAQDEFLAGNHPYFDSISRGANYVAVETLLQFRTQRHTAKNHARDCDDTWGCLDVYASVKPSYVTQDSRIYWGPLANSAVTITDYDRYRVILSNTFPNLFNNGKHMNVGVEWTVGDSGLKRDSVNVNIAFQAKSIFGLKTMLDHLPFYLRFHAGPMSTLSNYTQSQRSIGFGLIFR